MRELAEADRKHFEQPEPVYDPWPKLPRRKPMRRRQIAAAAARLNAKGIV